MALASAVRHVLRGTSTPSAVSIGSHFTSIRLISTLPTLTSPKLFIAGVSRNTTDENLFKAFSPFGRVVEAKVIIDRGTGRSKGFGFVTYETIEEADKAREEMNAKYLDGWVIFVDPAKPRDAQQRPPPPPRQHVQSPDSGFTANKAIGWSGPGR